MKLFLCKLFIFFPPIFLCFAHAIEVRFPKEELESEYLLPKFENNRNVVENRYVKFQYKLDLSASAFYRADELFYSERAYHGMLSFALNEMHGIGISGIYFEPGLSLSGQTLRSEGARDAKTKSVRKFFAHLAPHPQFALFLDYISIPFYGKLSFTKSIVSHLSIPVILGVGGMNLAQRENYNIDSPLASTKWVPVFRMSVQPKVFIGRRFYITGNFGFMNYYGPNPVNKNLLNQSQAPSLDVFDDVFFMRIFMGGGIGMLIL